MTLLILQTLWSPAWAVDVPSSQLAAGSITVAGAKKVSIVPLGGAAAVDCTVSHGTISACGDLFGRLASGQTVKATVDGKATDLAWAAGTRVTPATLDLTTRALDFGLATVPTTALLAVPGKGFYPLTAHGSTLEYATGAQSDLDAAAKACGTTCNWLVREYTGASEGNEYLIAQPGAKAAGAPIVTDKPPAPTVAPLCEAVLADTDRLSINPDILCVDVTGSHVSELTNIRDRLLFPNRSLAVVVRHNATDALTVSVSGDRGYTDPVYDVPSMGQEKVASAQSEDAKDTSTVLTELSFAPRKPGKSVDVVIAKNGTTVRTSELEVVPVYIGAVRIGIAAGSAIDQTFGTAIAPGSDQTEIVVTSGATTTFQPELVVGFAPFLFTPRGRSYVTARKAIDLKYVAPYLGLGVASLDAEATVKFSLLKSVYLGAEYEMGRYASIGVAAQLRQVTRLATPYEVGGSIDGTTVPTTTDYSPGIAFFFNVSPDFFRVVQPLAK